MNHQKNLSVAQFQALLNGCINCFNVYLSVICRATAEKISDILTYKMLIIEASIVHKGNAWLGYDHWFRQAAAANPNMQWSKTDTDLWHLVLQAWQKGPGVCIA